MIAYKKIAIIYDWIDKWGGVERVLLAFHEIFPKADFYSSYFDPERAAWANVLRIKSSFIQLLPKFIRRSRIASVPFYPYAFESFNFSDYDLVISVTSSFAKSVITKPNTFHICYLLTPTRYLWVNPELYIKGPLAKLVWSGYLNNLREWDYIAAQRPDKIISISKAVSDRCKDYYKRETEVVYPPFDIEYWKKIKSRFPSSSFQSISKFQFPNKKKYFLVVSRLEPYKKVDLVIQLFNQLNHMLVIVGEGSEEYKLKATASKNIIFLNKLTDMELGYLYSNAETLIMPQEEDFGYVSLEAQFFGCPVIAYHKGGALETVIDGKTGIFFNDQNSESLLTAVEKFNLIKYDIKHKIKEFGIRNMERFDKPIFVNKFLKSL